MACCPIAEFAGHLGPAEWIPLWLEDEAAMTSAALPKFTEYQELISQEIDLRTHEGYTFDQQDVLTINGPADVFIDFDLLPQHQTVIDKLYELAAELGVPWFPCPCRGCQYEQQELIYCAKQRVVWVAHRLRFVARTLCRRKDAQQTS